MTQGMLYDESGNLVRQVNIGYGAEGESLSTSGSTAPLTTRYDSAYRILSQTDGNNHARSLQYNLAGYPSQGTLANGETIRVTSYDSVGHPLTSLNGRGATINYTYNDPENRLTDIQYPATPGLNVHWSYDSYGREQGSTDTTGSKSFSYDDGNRTTSIGTIYKNAAGTGNLPTLTLNYGFYPDGSRQSLSTPAGSFRYTYDGRSLLSSLTNPAGEAFNWTYLDNGWMWKQKSGNAFTSVYSYNGLGWMTDLSNIKNDGNNTLLSDFNTIRHDAVGNHLGMTSNLPAAAPYSGACSYSYDGLDQILQETSTRAGGYTNNFGYDAATNATTFKGVTQTFNSANENTTGATTYDGDGNPNGWRGNALTFDPNSQLTALGSLLTAGYDSSGLRAWKQNAGGRTYFLYGADQVVPVCEVDNNGNVTAYNTYAADGLLARHTNGTGGGSVFYSFDPQGNTAQRLDPSGTILSSTTCDAFGTVVTNATGNDPYNGFGAQWGYYKDSETGLSLLGLRYYDPGSGRFLNRDPAQMGINWYTYCSNNPLDATDPTGLTENSVRNRRRRQRIAKNAIAHDGSSNWGYGKAKGNFPANSWKCNEFVYDILKQSGVVPPTTNDGWPAQAGDWANPKNKMKNWRPLGPKEPPQPGDVGAYPLGPGAGATGHSGIIVPIGKSVGDIAAHRDRVGPPEHQFTPPFDHKDHPTPVYRRYIGE